MTTTTSRPPAAAVLPATAPLPPTAPPAAPLPPTDSASEYHRLARAIPHRRTWWRPLAAVGLFALTFGVMGLVLILAGLAVAAVFPTLMPSASMMDPRNPMDMLGGLGLIALFVPAVLIASRIAYGSAGMTHSVRGRFRWGLLGRAALVVVPVYLVLNIGVTVAVGGADFEMPPLTAPVIAAWVIIVLLVPLQAAGEEYAFRALPMQMFGTWLRSPLWGILIPVPLFMAGHEYHWVGQVDLAVFAIAMGLLAWKTGGLELPILLHVANNWTLFLLAPLMPNALEQGAVPPSALLFSTVPVLLLTAGLWWWHSRREGLGLWEPTRGTRHRRADRPAVSEQTWVCGALTPGHRELAPACREQAEGHREPVEGHRDPLEGHREPVEGHREAAPVPVA